VIVAALSLTLSTAMDRLAPLPVPKFHDEFSYLLAGETFARGRLTNPPPQFWWCLETFQVLVKPTYMSKYPPVQGLILAAGRLLFNEPIVGVWVSTALACAAAWWGLAGLLPRRWAAIGAVIVLLHPLMLRWNWSYWGGAGSMIGGGLLVGAIARLRRAPNLTSGCLLGLGMGILLNSRPFEGAVLTLACTLLILRSRGPKSVVPRSRVRTSRYEFIVGCLVVMCGVILWTGYYNYRVTGRATQFPYLLYESRYAVTPPLIWMPPHANVPRYGHHQMLDYYLNWEMPRYAQQRRPAGLAAALGEKSWAFLRAHLGSPALIVALAAAAWTFRRDRTLRWLAMVAAVSIAAAFSGLWYFPHYTSPAAIVFLAIAVQGMRHIRVVAPYGRAVVAILIGIHMIAGLLTGWQLIRPAPQGWALTRAQFQSDLSKDGKHLVIVRNHASSHFDWVYNDPEPERSAVVWARDMGADENRLLVHVYRDRTIWLLDVDETAAALNLYPGPTTRAAAEE
jgi:hypothetical protein